MRLYLIGFMGSGKSFLGKQLASGLGCDFIDLDTMIEEGEGMSISTIFSEKGEQSFRALEAEYLRETEKFQKAIIATGGGAPCFSANMEWMNKNGVTLYLDAPVEILFQRLKMEKEGRPLLANLDDEELMVFIDQLLKERQYYYKATNFSCRAEMPIEKLAKNLMVYFKRFFS